MEGKLYRGQQRDQVGRRSLPFGATINDEDTGDRITNPGVFSDTLRQMGGAAHGRGAWLQDGAKVSARFLSGNWGNRLRENLAHLYCMPARMSTQ